MAKTEIQRVQEFLPHRYPFLLVDRIQDVDTQAEGGPVIRAYKNVTINEDFFNGHFPGHPIMPGVLILEAMAQVAGILGLILMEDQRKDSTVYYFAGAEHVRFRKPVIPGDQLCMEARYLNGRRGIWKFECKALVDGEVVCQAEITSAARELEQA